MKTTAMPEHFEQQSSKTPQYIECLLSVRGDTAFLNAFDKTFRSGFGPQWADRPPNTKPRYSFHALFPVPEEIQRRGFLKAGRRWCTDYWEAGGDLCEMQVKRVLGERRYRFFAWDTIPKNIFRVISLEYPTLKFYLTGLILDDKSVLWNNEMTLREYMIANGRYTGSYRRNENDTFSKIREGMGFLP